MENNPSNQPLVNERSVADELKKDGIDAHSISDDVDNDRANEHPDDVEAHIQRVKQTQEKVGERIAQGQEKYV